MSLLHAITPRKVAVPVGRLVLGVHALGRGDLEPRTYYQRWYQRNKAMKLEYERKRRKEHRERIAKQKAAYYRANLERERKKRRDYYRRNREAVLARVARNYKAKKNEQRPPAA